MTENQTNQNEMTVEQLEDIDAHRRFQMIVDMLAKADFGPKNDEDME